MSEVRRCHKCYVVVYGLQDWIDHKCSLEKIKWANENLHITGWLLNKKKVTYEYKSVREPKKLTLAQLNSLKTAREAKLRKRTPGLESVRFSDSVTDSNY